MGVRRAQRPVRPLSARTAAKRAELRARLTALGVELAVVDKLAGGKREGKFHNVKATYNGETYDSAGEAEYAWKLDQRLKAGEIVHWERPSAFLLLDAPKARDRITYKPDFWIIPAPAGDSPRDYTWSYYVDFKGSHITETTAWRMKVKLWKQTVPFELRVAYPDGSERTVAAPTA